MKELRDEEENDGPLKIIKLPTATAPILFMSDTPQTLRELGLHGKHSKINTPDARDKQDD